MLDQKDGPNGSFYDGHQLFIPTDQVKPNPDNPRDPIEIDYRHPDFRALVEDINSNGGQNHTPIQVYIHPKDGMFHIVAGHRRLEAVKKASQNRMIEWEQSKVEPKPEEVKFIYATLVKAPATPFEKGRMMFSAEETSKRWGDVRKFRFFRDMVNGLPETIQKNPSSLRKKMYEATRLSTSTVNTFCDFYEIPPIGNAMGELRSSGEDTLPRVGRVKVLRSLVRIYRSLVSNNPSLVRQYVESVRPGKSKELSRPQLHHIFAQGVVAKAFHYHHLRNVKKTLMISPGVALERTTKELNSGIPDYEVLTWLTDPNRILKQNEVEHLVRQTQTTGSIAARVEALDLPYWKIQSPSKLIRGEQAENLRLAEKEYELLEKMIRARATQLDKGANLLEATEAA